MRRILFFILFISSISIIQAQTVRDFRLGTWGMFPWVEPSNHEQQLLTEINTNHINAWILNPNDNVYPEYTNYYANFSTSQIRWLERAWMDYLNSTSEIGMYVGCNGWKSGTSQNTNQIEVHANNYSFSHFESVFNDYLTEFGNDAGLQGYYVSHEDINDPANHSRIEDMLAHIRANDPNHELVIEHWNLGASQWAANNTDKYDIFESTFYVFDNLDPYSSSSHQTDLDEIINRANNNMNGLTGSEVDWHAIIQTYAFEPVSSPAPLSVSPEGLEAATVEPKRRWPTREEMYASAYLCLSRGARGIKTFLYGSTDTKDSTGTKTGDLNGVLTDDFTTQDRPKQQTTINGNPVFPFEYVKELFAELEVIKDVFPQIEVDDAYTASTASGSKYATTTGNWIEAGVFHNRVQTLMDEKYILLVNRVCNNSNGSPATSQTITVTLNDGFSGKRIVENLYLTNSTGTRDQTAVLSAGEDDFSVTIGPGEGKLFLINYLPATPSNFNISGSTGQHPTLTWNANTENDLDGYNIYVRYGSGDYGYLTSVDKNTTSFTDPGVIIGSGKFLLRVCYKIDSFDLADNKSDKTPFPKCVSASGINKPACFDFTKEYIPEKFQLYPAYPNPFNPTTNINFDLPKETQVELQIFNIKGQMVSSLINNRLEPGRYTFQFDAINLTSGVYFYRISAGRFTDVKRMILIK